ncbi:MAG: hypothetical protein K6F87_06620 [Lachnospiraceae bacterium]|nr:hypothetical protein [Lachnospiraceae bacterium]
MEIIVVVLGTVGFVMSWVIIGAVPAALAVILGALRLMVKKKPLRKLQKAEIVMGMIFGLLAIGISAYVYYAGVMDIDFVRIIRQEIDDITSGIKGFFGSN